MTTNIEEVNLPPALFVERWYENVKRMSGAYDSQVFSTAMLNDHELSIVCPLKDRILKHKKSTFNDCRLTLYIKEFNGHVYFKIGLVYGDKKKGSIATTWRVIKLLPNQYTSASVLYAKLIIAAANLTGQGKIETNVCDTFMSLITSTLNEGK